MSALAEKLTLRATEPLVEALRGGGIGDFRAVSPFAGCLMPMLAALDWRGDRRRLLEALPHFANNLDLDDLRNVLAELGFPTKPLRTDLGALDPRLLPCLFVRADGRPIVAVAVVAGRVTYVDPEDNERREMPVAGLRGMAYVVPAAPPADAIPDERSFMARIAERFRPLVWQLLALTLVIDLATIAGSLSTMLVYDKVIGSHAPDFLLALGLGLGFLFLCDWGLRLARLRMVAFIGARIDRLVGVATIRQLLTLPMSFVESAPVGSQASRLKEFEGVRDFFTGPLAQLVLELPFLLLAVVVLFAIAGSIAFVPVALTALFALVGWIFFPPLRRAIAAAGRARSQRHGFLVEMLGGMRAIRQTGVEDVWLARYKELSAETAARQDRAQQWSLFMHTASQILVLVAGVTVLALGIRSVIAGAMTVGALVATMAIVWRVLTPLQLALVMLPRLEMVLRSIAQINQLMRLRPARPASAAAAHAERVFRGDLQAMRISHRYRADTDPALLAVDLVAKRGEIVAVVGNSGSGKSTLLKVIAGLYQPQGGQVTIDGIDIRQLPPGELQRATCYLPQNGHLFHGTIEQNLRLAEPTVSAHDLTMALEAAGAVEDVNALPEGIGTRIGDNRTQALPAGLLQRLSLARVFLSRAPIILLDEPGQSLDDRGDAALKNMLQTMRGRRTVILVSHRPSHIALCDRVLLLADGRGVRDQPAAEFLKPSKGPSR